MKRTIRVAVPACGGEFVVWWPMPKGPPIKYYGEPSREGEASRRRVTFERGKQMLDIDSAKDLLATIVAEGGTPDRIIAEDPISFAVIFGFLLDIEGRVVEEVGGLWQVLDDRFGISSRESVPKIDGDWLRFCAARPVLVELDGSPPHPTFERLAVNLTTGEVQRQRSDMTVRKE